VSFRRRQDERVLNALQLPYVCMPISSASQLISLDATAAVAILAVELVSAVAFWHLMPYAGCEGDGATCYGCY
jgi:hypothetical protein